MNPTRRKSIRRVAHKKSSAVGRTSARTYCRAVLGSHAGIQKNRIRTRSGSACKSTNVRKSIVLNSRSIAGGPQMRAEISRYARNSRGGAAGLALARLYRIGSQQRRHKIFSLQHPVEGHALVLILRRKGAASDQIARPGTQRVSCNSLPEHV